MTTREELLNEFENNLDGWIIRCDAAIHPVTGQVIPRNENQYANMPDKKSQIIEIEESPDGSERLERHIVYFWDDTEKVKKNVQFYCVNRNQPEGYADWFRSQNPKPEPRPESFSQKVLEWLRDKVGMTIGALTIKHVVRASGDDNAQTATATILVEEDGALRWLNAFLYKDAQGDINWEEIPAEAGNIPGSGE